MKLAHNLSPVATIGKRGLSEEVAAHVDRELSHHELVKVRFSDWKEMRGELSAQLSERLGATLVSVIGNNGVLYRRNGALAEPKVVFPQRRRSMSDRRV